VKELDTIIRAAVRVVLTRREAQKATEDGASEAARKKYGAAFSKALDELERAVAAFAKAPKPAKAPAAPFNWAGLTKSVIALARLARKVQGKNNVEQVVDVIDAEVIE
jgi:hypothetical protein